MCPFLLISCCDLLWCAGGEVWRLDYMRQKGRRYSTMEYGELWRMDYDIIFKENAL